VGAENEHSNSPSRHFTKTKEGGDDSADVRHYIKGRREVATKAKNV
jgi:hypothetical protein